MLPILKVILLSILPISELRGGIPVGLYHNLPLWEVVLVSVLANIAIILPLFFFLNYLHHIFMQIKPYKHAFNFYVEKRRHKAQKALDRYGYPGLLFFVAIPLPMTGAYTGTLIAWIFGLNQKKAFFYIALGVIIAAIIVTLVSVLGVEALGFLTKKINFI